MCFIEIMNTSGHLPVSASAMHPLTKRRPRGRPRKQTANGAPLEKEQAAVGTLTRTKSLILAALRVWELKQRGLG